MGFLAKVAIAVKGRLEQPPTIIVDNPDVRKMLDVMGFSHFFTLMKMPLEQPLPEAAEKVAEVPADEQGMRQRILEAHRILMHMNEHNREQFQTLVDMLEDQDKPPE